MTEGSDDSAGMETLLSQTSVVFVTISFGMGAGILSRLLLADYLGSEAYGVIVFGLTTLNFASIFALVGLPQAIAQRVPQANDASAPLVRALLISLSLSIVFIAGLFMFRDALSRLFVGVNWQLQTVFVLSLPALVVLRVSVATLRGLGIVRGSTIVKEGIWQGLKLLFVAVGIGVGADLLAMTTAVLAPMLIAAALSLLLLTRFEAWPRWRDADLQLHPVGMRSLLAFSVPLMLTTLSWDILERLDNYLLVAFTGGTTLLGQYDLFFMIGKFLFIIGNIFGWSALPVFSGLVDDDQPFESEYRRLTRLMTLLTAPVYVVIVLYGGDLLGTFLGAGYQNGSATIGIVASGFMFALLLGLNQQALVAYGHSRTVLHGTVLGLYQCRSQRRAHPSVRYRWGSSRVCSGRWRS